MVKRTDKLPDPPIGTLHPKDTMFLREHVGEANDINGDELYVMSVILATREPVVCSATTGKWFTLTWQQIIELAQKAGIDK